MRTTVRICMSVMWLLSAWHTPAKAQMVITELMQGNVDCVMDDLNEFPDSWVELHNTGSTAVDLNTYAIGTTGSATEAWTLPHRMVAPGAYVLIWCDKEASGLHTDFRLESGNDASIFLLRNGIATDSVVHLKKQPAPNIAWGRCGNQWGYQAVPTPGAENCGEICANVLGEPLFSREGCVITGKEHFQLTLSLPDGAPAETQIRMTFDGSEPTTTSPLYTSPITIAQTRTVRAKLFCKGWLSPRSTTHSYIFFPREMTMPVVSLCTNNTYLTDSKIGIYVEGNYQSGKKNYQFNWRRPVNFELFTTEGTDAVLNQLCETRVMGGASRDQQLKSLVVYAQKRFGKKRMKYEFFPDQRPGQTDFKSILLRNAGNDFDYLYMRDAVIQRTMAQNVDIDWQAWRPAVVYINGQYKGMLNIRERSTKDNIYTNYDGLEDIDMIENWHELKEGDKENWERFCRFYAEHGHTLEEYAQWLDWEEFLNLMLMNMYYNNQDFPGNNIVMWRRRSDSGRWRFVAKDTDFGLGLYGSPANYNTIEWIYNPDYDYNRNWGNHYEHTRLFRRLMEDADFKREFIDRAAIYMGDFMNAEGTRAVWDPMYEAIRYEYPHHRELYNRWWPNYNEELAAARQWVESRTQNFYQQLADYYHLGTPTPLMVNHTMPPTESSQMEVCINGVKLTKGHLNGRFFAHRALTITAQKKTGEPVAGWAVTKIDLNNVTTSERIAGSELTLTMPECKNLFVNAVMNDINGICDTEERQWKWLHMDGGIMVEGLTAGTMVTLTDIAGRLIERTTAGSIPLMLKTGGNTVVILRVGNEVVKIKMRN